MKDKYFSRPGMSASLIKAGAVSMDLMDYRRHNIMTPTPAMLTGTMRHMAVLEPDRFGQLHICDDSGRTNAYKAAVAEFGREGVISTDDRNNHLKAAEMVFRHPVVVELGLFDTGTPEVERFWDCEHGPCKAKVDWESDDYWVEFKSTGSINNFMNQSEGMFYHLQVGWYGHAVGKKCYVIAQESKEPYDVAVYSVPIYMPDLWYDTCLEIYGRYNEYTASKGTIYGGSYPTLIQYERPTWAEGQDSLAEVDIKDLAF